MKKPVSTGRVTGIPERKKLNLRISTDRAILVRSIREIRMQYNHISVEALAQIFNQPEEVIRELLLSTNPLTPGRTKK